MCGASRAIVLVTGSTSQGCGGALRLLLCARNVVIVDIHRMYSSLGLMHWSRNSCPTGEALITPEASRFLTSRMPCSTPPFALATRITAPQGATCNMYNPAIGRNHSIALAAQECAAADACMRKLFEDLCKMLFISRLSL